MESNQKIILNVESLNFVCPNVYSPEQTKKDQ